MADQHSETKLPTSWWSESRKEKSQEHHILLVHLQWLNSFIQAYLLTLQSRTHSWINLLMRLLPHDPIISLNNTTDWILSPKKVPLEHFISKPLYSLLQVCNGIILWFCIFLKVFKLAFSSIPLYLRKSRNSKSTRWIKACQFPLMKD